MCVSVVPCTINLLRLLARDLVKSAPFESFPFGDFKLWLFYQALKRRIGDFWG